MDSSNFLYSADTFLAADVFQDMWQEESEADGIEVNVVGNPRRFSTSL